MCCMIAINSVFAGYEMALASVSLARLQTLNAERRRGAKAALHMKQRMEASLTTVQIGITLVGAIAAAVGGAGAEEKIAPMLQTILGWSPEIIEVLSLSLVVIPLTAVTIFVGELIPKVFALRYNEWMCLAISPLMLGFALAAWPIVRMYESGLKAFIGLVDRFLRLRLKSGAHGEAPELAELRAVTVLARSLKLIGRREESIILSTLALSRTFIRDVMVPIQDVTTLCVTNSLAESLIAAHMDMHTRFPVIERPGDPQSIIGYVNFKDIVAQLRMAPQAPSLRAIVRPLIDLSEQARLAQCLDTIMKGHVHIATVRNASGAILGMVTLEDILEELVGDITDEYDRLPAFAVMSGSGWVIGGGMPLVQLREKTGIDLTAITAVPNARLFTEWCEGHLGRGIQGGDIIESGNLRIVVRKIRRSHVFEAQVNQKTRAES
ncbi:MAG TPA: hemolysin family protein [Candidatus Hydrogenedentes bacterium]|nr:hemolysin family protein [Candidatus Hydrogenedentota bacterium]